MSEWISKYMDEVQGIDLPPLPFKLDEKVFSYCDEEGNIIGEPYSYNDWIKEIKNISGVNPDLLGPKTCLNIES